MEACRVGVSSRRWHSHAGLGCLSRRQRKKRASLFRAFQSREDEPLLESAFFSFGKERAREKKERTDRSIDLKKRRGERRKKRLLRSLFSSALRTDLRPRDFQHSTSPCEREDLIIILEDRRMQLPRSGDEWEIMQNGCEEHQTIDRWSNEES